MKSLIWKEWHENFKWAAVPALLILGPMGLFGAAALMDLGHLFYVSLVAALFGAMLGFLQVFPESRGDRRALLLHRPLSRTQIFVGKVLAGMGLYLLALGIPFVCGVALAATPAHVAQPFSGPMVLPWLADILTGLVYYFAGMLAAQREARWYGSRCLGLAAGLFCSIVVWSLPEFWQALVAILIVGGAAAVAAWGSFCAGGAYAPQPRLAKIALAVTLLIALSALSFTAKTLLGRHLEPGTRYTYLVDQQGRVLDVHDKDGEVQSVADLEGQFPPELQGVRLDLHALLENSAPEARVDQTRRQSYRSFNRFLVKHGNETKPGNEVWWYVPGQGRLLGYDTVSKRLIGVFGPDGFVPPGGNRGDAPPELLPGEKPRGRFEGELYHVSRFPEAFALDYLAFPRGVFKIDFHKRAVQTLFVPAAEETVLWASRWEDAKKTASLAFVGTDRSIHVVDERGSRVFSAPLAYDLRSYRIRSAGRLNSPQRYWIWFHPQWYLGAETLETMPACVVEYDTAGREVGRRTVPPQPARPGDARLCDPRMLVFEPSYNVALSGLATPPAEFAVLVGAKQYLIRQARWHNGTEMSVLLPFLFYSTQFFLPGVGSFPRADQGLVLGFAALILLSAVVCGLVCLLLARRNAFSRARQVGWTLCGLIWGPTGLLLMLALQEWPAHIACPRCLKPRVVTRETCEHCGAPQATPAPDGTEIFEVTAATQQLAMAEG
jgi:YD repeat-containing protein